MTEVASILILLDEFNLGWEERMFSVGVLIFSRVFHWSPNLLEGFSCKSFFRLLNPSLGRVNFLWSLEDQDIQEG